jgi:long-chain fatty acid transport protein
MEGFHYQTADNTGKPRDVSYGLNLPGIVSLGIGYTGFERWIFDADFRYVDYANATGFSATGFNPDGSLAGPGFRSVFAMALGAQYELSDTITVRGGYSYNGNPISNQRTSDNIASPVILQHAVSVGFTYHLTDAFSLSAAYQHWFQNSIEGPFNSPFGVIPGTSVRSTVSADSVILGATVRFGVKGS